MILAKHELCHIMKTKYTKHYEFCKQSLKQDEECITLNTSAVESKERMPATSVITHMSQSSLLGLCQRYSLPSPKDNLKTACM